MSTISSTTDITTKYHRVASEYAKLKAQIPVLKNAVLSEQAKTKRLTKFNLRVSKWSELQDENHAKESALRKLEAENESLGFRNNQLLKRVEALQLEIDKSTHQHSGKKRPTSSSAAQSSTPSSAKRLERPQIDTTLLEEELMVKVQENERLHSKIFELESLRDKDIAALNEKCVWLQKENDMLRSEVEKLRVKALSNVAGDRKEDGGVLVQRSESKSKMKNQRGQENELIRSVLQQQQQQPETNGCAYSEPSSSTNPETVSQNQEDNPGHALIVDSLRSTHTLITSFSSLLRLLEQRSTIYPNDMNFEVLPESTKLYGERLVRSVDLIDNITMRLDEFIGEVIINEEETRRVTAHCQQILPCFVEAFSSIQNWKELFCEGIDRENRLAFAGPKLCKSNEEWQKAFSALLEWLLQLAQRYDSNIKECVRVFSSKIFAENHIPTASKRLRCVNECIEKCLRSLSRNVENLDALLIILNDTLSNNLKAMLASSGSTTLKKSEEIANSDDRMLGSVITDDYVDGIAKGETELLSRNGRLLREVGNAELVKTSKAIANCATANDSELKISSSGEQSTTQAVILKQSSTSCDDLEKQSVKGVEKSHSVRSNEQELNSALKRALELEKEKERILVERELLKMKLASLSISSAAARTDNGNGDGDNRIGDEDDLELLGIYHEKRVGELLAQLQLANSRAGYYKTECEQLLRETSSVVHEKETLSSNLMESTRKIVLLNDDLETTRKGYEDQMRSLYEHLGELNTQLEHQTDTITSLRETSNQQQQHSNGFSKQGSRRLLFK
ncbi:unnamed protein product [Anisakis simplex]|uniref:Protein phosphatase 1 regulatory subunit 21 n=1 Tax=Anisakis simplex TaxID=6269 RepID=A0A0M3K3S6_ANISI|nr:unnamed protein product [Anisakis simplex]